MESQRPQPPLEDPQRDNDDPHLRSAEEVTGYHILASDGEIGHVRDFLLEDDDWSIRYIVVDTIDDDIAAFYRRYGFTPLPAPSASRLIMKSTDASASLAVRPPAG